MATYPGTTQTTGGSRLAIIGATALTLAALASIVGWHLRTEQQGTERAPATTISTQALPSAAGVSEPAPATMYLVDAPEAAAFLRQFLTELNDRRRALGQAPLNDSVSVVETTLDAEAAAALPRPPNTTIYDLRQPVAGGRTTETSTRP